MLTVPPSSKLCLLCATPTGMDIYIQVHTHRHLPSAVPWISEDCLLWKTTCMSFFVVALLRFYFLWLWQVAMKHAIPESVFGSQSLHNTLCMYYFLMIGRFSATKTGCVNLEKSGIFQRWVFIFAFGQLSRWFLRLLRISNLHGVFCLLPAFVVKKFFFLLRCCGWGWVEGRLRLKVCVLCKCVWVAVGTTDISCL